MVGKHRRWEAANECLLNTKLSTADSSNVSPVKRSEVTNAGPTYIADVMHDRSIGNRWLVSGPMSAIHDSDVVKW